MPQTGIYIGRYGTGEQTDDNIGKGMQAYDEINQAHTGTEQTYDTLDQRLDDMDLKMAIMNEKIDNIDGGGVGRKTDRDGEAFNSAIDANLYAHAEGYETWAEGLGSHAIGNHTLTLGQYSYAEGNGGTLLKKVSLTGVANSKTYQFTIDSSVSSTAVSLFRAYGIIVYKPENGSPVVSKISSMKKAAKDSRTGEITLDVTLSASEDLNNIECEYYTGPYSTNGHVEGFCCIANSNAHAEGTSTYANQQAHAEGYETYAQTNAHAEGWGTSAIGMFSHTEGYKTYTSGARAHIEGSFGISGGQSAHAEGENVTITESTSSSGTKTYTYTDGLKLNITSSSSNTYTYTLPNQFDQTLLDKIGFYCLYTDYMNSGIPRSGYVKHIDKTNSQITLSGKINTAALTNESIYIAFGAFGRASHVEGRNNIAVGSAAHAEGFQTAAYGYGSHAEGNNTYAGCPSTDEMMSGKFAHAEGVNTIAHGIGSHAEGLGKSLTEGYQSGNWLSVKRQANYKLLFSGYGPVKSNAINRIIMIKPATTSSQPVYAVISDIDYDNKVVTVIGNNLSSVSTSTEVRAYFINGAAGDYSHCEGKECCSGGVASHAEGYLVLAAGDYSHAEGVQTQAYGQYAHAEGYGSIAYSGSHAEGDHCVANNGSHAEGTNTSATGHESHSEGRKSESIGDYSHSEGYGTFAYGPYSHAEGAGKTLSSTSVPFVNVFSITGSASTRQYTYTVNQTYGDPTPDKYLNKYVCCEIDGSKVFRKITAINNSSKTITVSSTFGTALSGKTCHIIGGAVGEYSHTEGRYCNALGNASHAEGENTEACGDDSHTEGYLTVTVGKYAHAEGNNTYANGNNAHTEGRLTYANGTSSHCEGELSKVNCDYGHVEGYKCESSPNHSSGRPHPQHVEGALNEIDSSNKYVHIVGNGYETNSGSGGIVETRSNAHTLDWDGNAWYAGNVTIAGNTLTIGNTTITEEQLIALLALIG